MEGTSRMKGSWSSVHTLTAFCFLAVSAPGCQSDLPSGTSPFSCAQCDVEAAEEVVLGSRADRAGPSGLARVAVGLGGNLVLISDMAAGALPLVYSPSGEFLGELGARGSGPGEFGAVIRLASSPGGLLVLYDAHMGVHLFGPDGGFLRRLSPSRAIPQPLREPVILEDTILAVASLSRSARTPERPVELFDLGTGEFIGGTGPASGFSQHRGIDAVPHIAPACGGEIWSHGREPSFTRWDARGEQTASFALDPAMLDDAARAAGIPGGEIATLRLHDDCEQGIRWIALLLRDPSEAPRSEAPSGGAPLPLPLLSPSHINRSHNTLLLVVDEGTDTVLGGTALHTAFSEFLRDGRLVTTMEDDQGHQSVVLHRLTFRRSGSGNTR